MQNYYRSFKLQKVQTIFKILKFFPLEKQSFIYIEKKKLFYISDFYLFV